MIKEAWENRVILIATLICCVLFFIVGKATSCDLRNELQKASQEAAAKADFDTKGFKEDLERELDRANAEFRSLLKDRADLEKMEELRKEVERIKGVEICR